MTTYYQIFHAEYKTRMEVEGQFAAARVQYEQAIRCNPEVEQVAREMLHVLLDRLLDSLSLQENCVRQIGLGNLKP